MPTETVIHYFARTTQDDGYGNLVPADLVLLGESRRQAPAEAAQIRIYDTADEARQIREWLEQGFSGDPPV